VIYVLFFLLERSLGAIHSSTSVAFPGTRVESDLVNRLLPALLTTRLPGDDCPLWQAN
jgi:hypothetical protein